MADDRLGAFTLMHKQYGLKDTMKILFFYRYALLSTTTLSRLFYLR